MIPNRFGETRQSAFEFFTSGCSLAVVFAKFALGVDPRSVERIGGAASNYWIRVSKSAHKN